MADKTGSVPELNHPVLNLTPEEKRYFSQLFAQADTEKIGVITGEVAVKFFERTKLSPTVLGEIWQIADTENRGLLTSAGFCMVLRLIGHYQAGRDPSPELAFRPGSLPKFEGLNLPPAPPPAPAGIQPQVSGGPIRVPPLTPDKSTEYASVFETSGAVSGLLSGEAAKKIFEKARLPNETLGRIWNLADTEQRGALDQTEFVIAMHLLASFKSGAMKALPTTLPAKLYEAAARRIPPPPGRGSGTHRFPDPVPLAAQLSGGRTQSPLTRAPYGTPPQTTQTTGNDWAITPQEKAQYDGLFNKVDTFARGYITGEQAVGFFSDSGLPEDVLASIWDLADINSEGQLNRDEFAVAMHLIRQQRPHPGVGLPATLPPNLVPPSMRGMPRPTPQPTHPTFEPPPPNIPKSATDDLFGLDAFSAPAGVQQQSTGGSAPLADPFGGKATSPTSQTFTPAPRTTGASYQPFLPTSQFGQNLAAKSTGTPSGSRGASTQQSAMDDLLDVDPEVSKKLTQETAELANMSNQIGTLRTQMQEVQNKKVTTESDLSTASSQKRELEVRLSQFRAQYEQEVRNVKALEDRLATSRGETRKLSQELALLEGTYQDLMNQRRHVSTELESDLRENASLKDRIKQVNEEIGRLRPELDKLRSDSRQQKGLVAINKKQLATNEGERDKIKNELSELHKAAQEAFPRSQSVPQASSSITSPAAAMTSQSTNPFFRKSPVPSDNTMSPSGFLRDGPKMDFDSVFGPAFPNTRTSPPPSTSFKAPSQAPTFSAQSGQSGPSVRSSEPDVPTPSTSPPLSSYHESPRASEPPAPPESRQFISNVLPLREGLPRTDSFSSSVKVSAPTSRYGGATGTETPTMSAGSPATPVQEKKPETTRAESGTFSTTLFDRKATSSPAASRTSEAARSDSRTEEHRDTFPTFGTASSSSNIPGAFPGDSSSPLKTQPTGDSTLSERSKASNRQDSFARVPASTKLDFDSAFAGFSTGRQFQEKQHTGSTLNGSLDPSTTSKFNKEFPPIEDLAHDEESDSSEPGFEDNFTSASPQQQKSTAGQGQSQSQSRPTSGPISGSEDFFRLRPQESLPAPNAQKSPQPYEQSTPSQGTGRSSEQGSTQFSLDFGGLLPPRQDPTPQAGSQSPEKAFSTPATGGQGQALFGTSSSSTITPTGTSNAFSGSPGPVDTPSTAPSDAYHSAVSFPSALEKGPAQQTKTGQSKQPAFHNDFDTGFEDLAEAKETDDKNEDFILDPHEREGLAEFNPNFDSPAASKSNTMASQQTPTGRGDFDDFDITQSFPQPGKAPQQPSGSNTTNWDAIFRLSPQANRDNQGEASKSQFPSLDSHPTTKAEPASSSSKAAEPTQLSRALNPSTEHDDPILKKLTGMGYPRPDALGALEKFDYDINKAIDYLASSH